jgi:hypothetical protein
MQHRRWFEFRKSGGCLADAVTACIQRRVEAGRRIGKYVLDERIAVGGMAEVWAAHVEGREGFVKPVALKFMLESFSGDPELERLFVDEARIAARLQHANLVTVFDFDKVGDDEERGLGGRYYIAMERVEGQDLRRIVEAARRAGYVFPVGLCLYVAGEMLKALRYVHEKRDARGRLGLVHRDVSPHNVLVAYSGEVKLSDFGIAKARGHSARNTQPGSMRGKIAYASPEQLAGGAVDHRTDQFAAGATIWEMLAGRRLFDGDSDLEIIGKVARCEIPALDAAGARRDVPSAVEAVVRRMLAADPAERYATTGEALSAVLGLAGYSPDGEPLGELVRALFTSTGAGVSRTMPVALLASANVAAATRTLDGGGPPVAARAEPVRHTPTRVAKRTAEALARSPAAAERSTTVDVRGGRKPLRFVGAALALGVVLVAGGLALRELLRDRAPGGGGAVSAAVSQPPRSVPTEPRPEPLPAAALPPPTSASPPRGPATDPAPPAKSAAVRAVEHRRAGKRDVPARAADAPVPVPSQPVQPSSKSSSKSSSNGAPIIE